MKAQIRFHGAAGEVTGSMHLVEANGYTIALDCGLFQGRRRDANEKNRAVPCPPNEIDAVVLSHAHVDHCGKLPRLAQGGFAGPIYATPATCDLLEVLLADSAHIQQEDTDYWNKKRVKRGDDPIEPLYTQADVEETLQLVRPQALGETFEVCPNITARFHEAGHMLGSAGVHIEATLDGGGPVGVTFSGDLGRPGIALLRDPAPLPACDYLICESTYGGRETPHNDRMRQQLAEVINDTIQRGGKVIIPAFSVGRTQTIVYHYHAAVHEGLIKDWIPLIVDSPLSVRATEIFRRHPEVFDAEAVAFRKEAGSLFKGEWCEYTRNVEESKALHERHGPMIIVSASGMCEAGRILHHIKNNVEDERNTILIVGYQAAQTLGRRLVEGVKKIKIFGEYYQVRATVKTLNGFSAHANSSELLAAVRPLAARVKTACLVHGEPDQAHAMARGMHQQGYRDVRIPSPGDHILLEPR